MSELVVVGILLSNRGACLLEFSTFVFDREQQRNALQVSFIIVPAVLTITVSPPMLQP
jgi:hypothetical protein